ncbi:MAG TPA: divalent-cation tolerance protein CutA, partial [Planctomycetota bacterium]|nr:divalent-cation tolerance protein CutA [Planctomycetota bacterium]
MQETEPNPWVVWTTAPSEEVASELARTLVQEGWAGCAQVLPGIESHYVWEGELRAERECLILLKTLPGAWSGLETRLRELHPYAVPEILAVPCVAWSAAYAAWLASQMGDPS